MRLKAFDGSQELNNALLELFDIDLPMPTPSSPAQARDEMVKAMDIKKPQPAVPGPQRFKRLSEDQLKEMEDERQSKSTKSNTKWGIKVFQDWNREVHGQELDISLIGVGDLCDKLRQFYAEASPKNGLVYHKNTLIKSGLL
ncbi:uncharacterized protein LOC117317012 [Pecten maximus]|uniref:uncharacterized protein LOC117317012 n=1 Tax=Pecten maximus TaxID=6579 RepID=UPI00145821A3|nr:uncharacterized protein LOC117317012 [Pecten maximus]